MHPTVHESFLIPFFILNEGIFNLMFMLTDWRSLTSNHVGVARIPVKYIYIIYNLNNKI